MVREWLKAFFRLLLKYKGVVRLTKAAEKALAISKNARRIQEILTSPERTEFTGVTIPEAMGFSELKRLMIVLEKISISCNHVTVNMIIWRRSCDFCPSKKGSI
jgi:arsenite-transporting ATPase